MDMGELLRMTMGIVAFSTLVLALRLLILPYQGNIGQGGIIYCLLF